MPNMVWIHDPAKKPMSPPLASRTQLDMTYSKCKEEIVEDSSPPAEKTGADSRRLSEDEPLRKKITVSPESHWCEKMINVSKVCEPHHHSPAICHHISRPFDIPSGSSSYASVGSFHSPLPPATHQHIKVEPSGVINYHVNALSMEHQQHHLHHHPQQQQQQQPQSLPPPQQHSHQKQQQQQQQQQQPAELAALHHLHAHQQQHLQSVTPPQRSPPNAFHPHALVASQQAPPQLMRSPLAHQQQHSRSAQLLALPLHQLNHPNSSHPTQEQTSLMLQQQQQSPPPPQQQQHFLKSNATGVRAPSLYFAYHPGMQQHFALGTHSVPQSPLPPQPHHQLQQQQHPQPGAAAATLQTSVPSYFVRSTSVPGGVSTAGGSAICYLSPELPAPLPTAADDTTDYPLPLLKNMQETTSAIEHGANAASTAAAASAGPSAAATSGATSTSAALRHEPSSVPLPMSSADGAMMTTMLAATSMSPTSSSSCTSPTVTVPSRCLAGPSTSASSSSSMSFGARCLEETPSSGGRTSSSSLSQMDASMQSLPLAERYASSASTTVVSVRTAVASSNASSNVHSDELDSEDNEEEAEEAAYGYDSSDSTGQQQQQHQQHLIEVSSNIEQSTLPATVRQHVEQLTTELNKLRQNRSKLSAQVKKLREDNKAKSNEIDCIKDLNIKLQLELEKYRTSDAYNLSYTYSADREANVLFANGITLTVYNLKDLECCEIGEKGDSAFILKLLLALYTRDELRMKSITGKPSRNKKYVQDTAEKFSPQKLEFIKEKFRERVYRENTLPTEREKRCRDERVHKIINTKIQNLKRKRATMS